MFQNQRNTFIQLHLQIERKRENIIFPSWLKNGEVKSFLSLLGPFVGTLILTINWWDGQDRHIATIPSLIIPY